MKDIHKSYLRYSAVGLGSLSTSYVLYRAVRKLLRGVRSSTDLDGPAKLTQVQSATAASSSGNALIPKSLPALAIIVDQDSGAYNEYSLNYTPQASSNNPEQMSSADYERLQSIGLIPQNFPQNQIVSVPSHNGRNQFFVGYSSPFSIKTNRDDLSVIQPVWAVSYGSNFETASIPPDNFSNVSEFYDVALRTTYAEWLLTNRGTDGCHKNQTLSACNVERSALLNLIIQRTHMKQQRVDEDLTYRSVIYGPKIRWNAGQTFMKSYEGPISDLAKSRFDAFYTTSFWQMPRFSGKSVNFIHPLGMSHGGTNPKWVKQTEPLSDTAHTYLAQHVVKLGSAVFSDVRRTFS